MREELDEVRAAGPETVEEELGDLLFATVALGRKIGVDAESALRRTARKFRDRIASMEKAARERGIALADLGPDELDRLWEEAKG